MLPTCRDVIARVAPPCAFSALVPIEVAPLEKFTSPLPTGVVPANTVAVRVTLCPTVMELAETVSVVIVGAAATVTVTAEEVLAA